MIDRRDFLRSGGVLVGMATATASGLAIASERDISRYAGPVGVVDPAHFMLAIAGTVLYTRDGQPVGVVERIATDDTATVIGVKSFLARLL